MKERIIDSFLTSLNNKTSFIFILIFALISVFDLTVIQLSSYSDATFETSSNVIIFTLFFLVFALTSILLLTSVKKNILNRIGKMGVRMSHFHVIIFAVIILTIAIMLAIIIQMCFTNKYDLRFLQSSTILTHLSALVFMITLVVLFARWLKSRKNYITFLFLLSFFLISVSMTVSLIYLEYQFSFSNSLDRKPYPIYVYVVRQEIRPFSESLGTIFDITSLLSFFTIWIATAMLLGEYRYKIGRIKYFTLIGIPMAYYLFTFQGYFGNMFSQFALHYPITFGVTYTLFFSATQQIGALLFSLAFLAASSLVTNESVRRSTLVSAIGIAILFGTVDITALQYRVYPPFGFVTEAFMPLGAYLLLVGLNTSAISVARDAKLRKELYKNAKSQINLLKTIGTREMEKELLKDYKSILIRLDELEDVQYQPLKQSDVKELIHDVLNELKARENITQKKIE